MQPIDIPPQVGAAKVVYGAGQPDYGELPALIFREGTTVTRWVPTPQERAAIAAGAPIELLVWTFGRPLQPVHMQVTGVEYPPDQGGD